MMKNVPLSTVDARYQAIILLKKAPHLWFAITLTHVNGV